MLMKKKKKDRTDKNNFTDKKVSAELIENLYIPFFVAVNLIGTVRYWLLEIICSDIHY